MSEFTRYRYNVLLRSASRRAAAAGGVRRRRRPRSTRPCTLTAAAGADRVVALHGLLNARFAADEQLASGVADPVSPATERGVGAARRRSACAARRSRRRCPRARRDHVASRAPLAHGRVRDAARSPRRTDRRRPRRLRRHVGRGLRRRPFHQIASARRRAPTQGAELSDAGGGAAAPVGRGGRAAQGGAHAHHRCCSASTVWPSIRRIRSPRTAATRSSRCRSSDSCGSCSR